MTGFQADPAALNALARRLEETAEDFATASADVDSTTTGDLGPRAVTAALTSLTAEWSGRIRAVQTDYAAAAESVRTAAKAYSGADTSAAEVLGRIAGPDDHGLGRTPSRPPAPGRFGQSIVDDSGRADG
ncbi:type VII secretion target [Amycolatopsis heterodermiae]|uniref:type VII secretion target n=1 Tax=Amycolatopsis heterodermiae TaxID=3110235 RepID=UPI00396A7544